MGQGAWITAGTGRKRGPHACSCRVLQISSTQDPKYLKPHDKLLKAVADMVELHSSCKRSVVPHHNIHYRGTLPKEKWHALLGEAKFLLGTPWLLVVGC